MRNETTRTPYFVQYSVMASCVGVTTYQATTLLSFLFMRRYVADGNLSGQLEVLRS